MITQEDLKKSLLIVSDLVDNVDWLYFEQEIIDIYDRSSSREEFEKGIEKMMRRRERDEALLYRSHLNLLVRLSRVILKQMFGIQWKPPTLQSESLTQKTIAPK